MSDASAPNGKLATPLAGLVCGLATALFWAVGFVASRHGIAHGLGPADIAFHRTVWVGAALAPVLALRGGLRDLDGVGWGRGVALAIAGGIPFAMLSYVGFTMVPLGHGGVIQPSCAALFGLVLATLVLHERLPPQRALGALVIVGGLAVIGGEAVATIGTHGVIGDLMFATAGCFFGTFGMLLRYWRIDAIRATVVVSIVSFAFVLLHAMLIGVERIIAAGPWENLLQAVVQGILAGPAAIYLFARSVALLGAGRAAVFPSLVPGFTLLIGFLLLHEVPSVFQVLGFAVVLVGFRLTQRT